MLANAVQSRQSRHSPKLPHQCPDHTATPRLSRHSTPNTCTHTTPNALGFPLLDNALSSCLLSAATPSVLPPTAHPHQSPLPFHTPQTQISNVTTAEKLLANAQARTAATLHLLTLPQRCAAPLGPTQEHQRSSCSALDLLPAASRSCEPTQARQHQALHRPRHCGPGIGALPGGGCMPPGPPPAACCLCISICISAGFCCSSSCCCRALLGSTPGGGPPGPPAPGKPPPPSRLRPPEIAMGTPPIMPGGRATGPPGGKPRGPKLAMPIIWPGAITMPRPGMMPPAEKGQATCMHNMGSYLQQARPESGSMPRADATLKAPGLLVKNACFKSTLMPAIHQTLLGP